jgi:hypothetical protein
MAEVQTFEVDAKPAPVSFGLLSLVTIIRLHRNPLLLNNGPLLESTVEIILVLNWSKTQE